MSDRSKPAVLRDMAVTAQSRSLPRHRPAAEPKAQPLRPVAGHPAVVKPVTMPSPPAENVRAKSLADELQAARETGLREGLGEAQRRLDEAMRAATQKLQAQTDALQARLHAEHDEKMNQLQQTLDGLAAAWAQRLDTLEPAAIDLAFAAVCRVMGQTHANRDAVAALVRQAMGQLRGGTLLRVRLHPGDLAALESDALVARHPAVQWVADATVEAGGCLLDTEHGTLDARLDRQLDRLRQVWVTAARAQGLEG